MHRLYGIGMATIVTVTMVASFVTVTVSASASNDETFIESEQDGSYLDIGVLDEDFIQITAANEKDYDLTSAATSPQRSSGAFEEPEALPVVLRGVSGRSPEQAILPRRISAC